MQVMSSFARLPKWILRQAIRMQMLAWIYRTAVPISSVFIALIIQIKGQNNVYFKFSAICKSGCHQERGYCRRPGECRCRVGWTGPKCEQCFPYPGCNPEHGSCRRPWECNCEPGWGGMLCDEGKWIKTKKILKKISETFIFLELNHCDKNPGTCKNGGKCRSLPRDDGLFVCECPSGFKGRQCELAPIPLTTTTTTTTTEAALVEIASSEEMTTMSDEDSTTLENTPVKEDEIENEAKK